MADSANHPWVEIAVDKPSKRAACLKLNKVRAYVRHHFGRVVYRSYYTGPDLFRRYLKEHQTPSGYNGTRGVPRIVFDIDGDVGDLTAPLEETRDLVRCFRAHDVPDGAILVWFSGNRGFHVEVPDLWGFEPKRTTPTEVKRTIEEFWPGADAKPLQQAGLIRARWSAHEKSELFKVPYLLDEVMNQDAGALKDLARNPMRYETGRKDVWQALKAEMEHPGHILSDSKHEEEEREIVAENNSGINRTSDDPSTKVTCMHKLWRRGPVEGRRNNDIHEMVRAWRSRGMGSAQCVAMAWAWVQPSNRTSHDMKKSEVEQIVHNVFSKGYLPSCDRDTYREFCDSKCIFFDEKSFGPKSKSLEDEAGAYLQRKKEGVNEVFNLNEIYPGVNFSLRGGEIMLLIGDTGLGKTSIYQNWAVKLTDSKKRKKRGLEPLRIFFNSSEMELDSMIDRFIQIQYGMPVNETEGVDDLKKAQEQGWLNEKRVKRATSGIHMSTDPLTTEELYNAIDGVRPDVLVIDPLEDVQVKDGGFDRVADQTQLIKDLQRIGAKTNTAVLVIHHINKNGMGKRRVDLKDGKGAKAIADKADFAVAFDGTRNSTDRTLRLLKKRRNQELYIPLEGDPDTWRFWQQGDDGSRQAEMDVQADPSEIPGDSQAANPDDVEISASGAEEDTPNVILTDDGSQAAGIVPDNALR